MLYGLQKLDLLVAVHIEEAEWRCFTTEPGGPCAMTTGTCMTLKLPAEVWGTVMLGAPAWEVAMDKEVGTLHSIMYIVMEVNQVSLTAATTDIKSMIVIIHRMQVPTVLVR